MTEFKDMNNQELHVGDRIVAPWGDFLAIAVILEKNIPFDGVAKPHIRVRVSQLSGSTEVPQKQRNIYKTGLVMKL